MLATILVCILAALGLLIWLARRDASPYAMRPFPALFDLSLIPFGTPSIENDSMSMIVNQPHDLNAPHEGDYLRDHKGLIYAVTEIHCMNGSYRMYYKLDPSPFEQGS